MSNKKPYIQASKGGGKRRVREWRDDVDYWHLLSNSERDWLMENYAAADLNNDLSNIVDRDERRRLSAANEAYYNDVANRSIQISLSKPDFDADDIIKDCVTNPKRNIRTESKPAGKRRYFGRVMTHRDWLTSYASTGAEDALIDYIDSKRGVSDEGQG